MMGDDRAMNKCMMMENDNDEWQKWVSVSVSISASMSVSKPVSMLPVSVPEKVIKEKAIQFLNNLSIKYP